ncbi:MAG: T9SS type A sorting domain-containing protein [Saprospiraceae bacterium]|nr:T9SS type A sorting domain-containing protein [Saprospiraceae bacterium]
MHDFCVPKSGIRRRGHWRPYDDGRVAPGWIGKETTRLSSKEFRESDDAWSVLLTGCYFNSDVLRSAEPVCLFKKDEGLLIAMKVRSPGGPIPGASVKVGRKPPGGNALIIQYGLNLNQQPGHQRLARIEDLLPLEDDDWYDLYIPYDLKNLTSEDSCGDQSDGIPGHLFVWMSNMLSNDQGDGMVRDAVILDQMCVDGKLVSVDQSGPTSAYRIWPNPGHGTVQVDLPAPALPGTSIKLVTLTGQTVKTQEVITGSTTQSVMVDDISSGMYFVVIERNGMTQAVFRWVCQK